MKQPEQMNLFETVTEPETDSGAAGFRLERFELLNWGTFDRRIWVLAPEGENTLLTGDIGSGKSTLVDALVTLLIPYQKITYNRAAGAEGRERSLASYIRGDYRRSEGKPVSLRDANSYSVLLACFASAETGEALSLAQVYWFQPGGELEKLFIVARRQLTIKEDFTDFGELIGALTRRLGKLEQTQVYRNFRDYQQAFRRWLGIPNEQALNLFYQTVSMKSVGDLTGFLRQHMLEAQDLKPDIERLRQEFDDLDRVHAAMVQAREQLECLAPVTEAGDRLEQAEAHDDAAQARLGYLQSFIQLRRRQLLGLHIETLSMRLNDCEAELAGVREQLGARRAEEKDLERAIDRDQAGVRLRELERQIRELTTQQQAMSLKWQAYGRIAAGLELALPHDQTGFERNRHAARQRLETLQGERQDLQERRDAEMISRNARQGEGAQLTAELASLLQRKTQLPLRLLELRQELLAHLGAEEVQLPFAGELMQVRAEAADWEGAIERVLHGFGLSLLVPQELYPAVSQWVDRRRLPGRLVYFRIKRSEPGPLPELPAESLLLKLELKAHPLRPWLEQELLRRYPLHCCERIEDFQSESQALSRQGQIKTGGVRHEKDDRYEVSDRSRYVLGWTNLAKIRALQDRLDALARDEEAGARSLAALHQRLKLMDQQQLDLQQLLDYGEYQEIDLAGLTADLERLQRLYDEQANASDQLRHLEQQVAKARQALASLEQEQTRLDRAAGSWESKLAAARAQLDQIIRQNPQPQPELEAELSARWAEPRDLEALERESSRLERALRQEAQTSRNGLEACRRQLQNAIRHYVGRFPAEGADIADSEAALPDLRRRHRQLALDDLPRHELRFRELLHQQTIQSLLLFYNRLDQGEKEIREKIKQINQSLRGIDYNRQPVSYIELVARPHHDEQILAFKDQLKDCLAHTDAEAFYSEARFFKVKHLIDQLAGRSEAFATTPGAAQRWLEKVIDVRHWFSFLAREIERDSGEQREEYSDSAGKSGGQKEKLAYTILASSLAFQFGLKQGQRRSFRFVVIDEAFGKGSDESTRYALELFREFGLQLMVVTPLQKISVIEPYVKSLHLVDNQAGQASTLMRLSIEELRQQRGAR